MNIDRERELLRGTVEMMLEGRQDLADSSITLLGSEQHPARVVFHFSSDEGHHSIVIERADWDAIDAERLAADAARRVLSEWHRRKTLVAPMPWQRADDASSHGRFDAA